MKTKYWMAALLAAASLAWGQKPKTQKEAEAVNAVVAAKTPDDRIKAVDDLLSRFKDTEYKPIVLFMAAQAAEQKGDSVNALIYGNRALEADPKNYQAMLLVSGELARGTKEFDLDKDEKLNRATKLANDAITTVGTAQKPNPQIPDDQWAAIKKDMIAEAHDTLGTVATVNKKYDAAIKEYQTSIDGASTQDPATSIRLASVYTDSKRYDDSIALLDKTIATPGLNDQFKKIATGEKQRAERLKAAQK